MKKCQKMSIRHMVSYILVDHQKLDRPLHRQTYVGKVDHEMRPHGRGFEYSPDGKLKYSGHFVNGERDGKGTLYFLSGRKAYEGDWKAGSIQGSGKDKDKVMGKIIK